MNTQTTAIRTSPFHGQRDKTLIHADGKPVGIYCANTRTLYRQGRNGQWLLQDNDMATLAEALAWAAMRIATDN